MSFKWLIHTLFGSRDYDAAQPAQLASHPRLGLSRNKLFHREFGLNFSIYPAEGGYVLSCNHYDEKSDRNEERLHLVPESQDLGTSIAHIITIELLRR